MQKTHDKIHYAKEVASFTVHLIPEHDGGFSVIVPALPGCNTQGNTFEEAERNAHEAIELYLESLLDNDEPKPYEGDTVLKRVTVSIKPAKV